MGGPRRWTVPSLALCLSLTAAGVRGDTDHRRLSFDERVEAQRSIERVYYSHQIGATRPFDEVITDTFLTRKVRTYLKQSVALDQFWNTPLTSAALQREMERMASATRLPGRLKEFLPPSAATRGAGPRICAGASCPANWTPSPMHRTARSRRSPSRRRCHRSRTPGLPRSRMRSFSA